jgi:hypothetical protein
MAVSIIINQAAAPPGVAGKAREDLATGVDVALSLAGGPFLAQQWSFVHKPIDIFAGVASSAALVTPAAATTLVSPINVPGTHFVQVVVNSGAGLGASANDISRITFYCGPTLNIAPEKLPRRIPGFQETTEHNVNDVISPIGNPEGWSREWYRWFAAIQRLYDGRVWAGGRIALTGAGAVITRAFNITSAVRTAQGVVDLTFTNPMLDALYGVTASPRNGAGFISNISGETVNKFTLTRANAAGAATDLDFSFAVLMGT